MKKIAAAFAIFTVFSQWASSFGSQEFEFELTDVFYPLLSKEESAELSKEMIKNARVSIYYGGKAKTIWSPLGMAAASIYAHGFEGGDKWTPMMIEESDEGEWKKPQSVEIKDGKLRIKADKSAGMTHIDPIAIMTNSFKLSKIRLYLPIHSIAKILDDELHEENKNLKFDIYAKEDKESELYKKGYRYAKSEYLVPIQNGVVAPNSDFFSGYYGAQFHATGKLSLVKDGKTTPSNDEPLLVDKTKKIYAIESGRRTSIADTIDVDKIKGLPKNVANIKARYLNRKNLEQFTLYASAKYTDEEGEADFLASFFLNQIKTHGKLYRIDASVNDVKYYRVAPTDAACMFGYGIEFYEDEEVRYFSYPKDDKHVTREFFAVGSIKYGINQNITDGDLTPVLEYEKHLEAYLDSKEKLASCKELLSYAKHILSAPRETLEKEFDEQYKTIGAEYQKIAKDGFYIGEKKDGKAHGDSTILYPDRSRLVGHFTDGNISRIKEIFYPNGNRLYMRSSVNEMKGKATLYLSKQPKLECDGYFENGTMSGEGFLNFKDKDENKYTYEGTFKNGVAEGEAEVIIETKTLYFRIVQSGNDDQPKLPPMFKNGRLEGKTYIRIWKGETFKGGYKVTFEDGKIVQNGGIKDEQLKIIEEYLEKLYPVRCDVRYTPRL